MSSGNTADLSLAEVYKQLWQQLKLNRSLAVKCPAEHQGTLIKGIINVKSRENEINKAVGLDFAEKLEIERHPHSVLFTLVLPLTKITLEDL